MKQSKWEFIMIMISGTFPVRPVIERVVSMIERGNYFLHNNCVEIFYGELQFQLLIEFCKRSFEIPIRQPVASLCVTRAV